MRMAIETRVHCLWNHLIESASHQTGSLLIWDTGEYEVLESSSKSRRAPETSDEEDDVDSSSEKPQFRDSLSRIQGASDSEKLIQAFRKRHIRLRLHGTRLPKGYTMLLRLPSANNTDGSRTKKPRYKRRKKAPGVGNPRTAHGDSTDSELGASGDASKSQSPELHSTQAHLDGGKEADEAAAASGGEDEDEVIRATNAYPGARNTIGSVHQRRWLLSLDMPNSGFVRSEKNGKWVRSLRICEGGDENGDETRQESGTGWEPFYVRGREHERSVVTGRRAAEIMADEGVERYVGRKMWRPIME